MRKIFTIWLMLLTASAVSAQLLYQISGNSAQGKSYILATNKLVDMSFIDTIPNAFKCFATCDKVLTE
ncbi:MAG: hypothetical protein J5612_02095, partial [Paludibacteraceae bacterium]|nr:hypothetical protein [Paludibacteraceae bacterium]